MDDGNAEPRRRLGDLAGADGVDREGQIGLVLGLVDRGIGGGRYDDVRPRCCDRVERPCRAAPDRAPAGRRRRPRCRRAPARASSRLRATCPSRPVTTSLTRAPAFTGPADCRAARRHSCCSRIGRHHHSLSRIPVDRLRQAALETLRRRPAELALDLGGIDGIAAVMARPVGDEADQVAVASGRRRAAVARRAGRRSSRRRSRLVRSALPPTL